jgi:hypothetical protein
MSQCHWCRRLHDAHQPECPYDKPKNSSERQIWWQGFRDAQSGRVYSEPHNPVYMMGWNQGDVENDNFQNHYNWYGF